MKFSWVIKCKKNLSTTDPGNLAFLSAILLVTSVYLVPLFPSISYGELLLAISIIYIVIIHKKIKVYNSYSLILFFLYGVLISIYMCIIYNGDLTQTITRLIRDTYYWILIYIFCYSFINYSIFKKWVKIICTMLSVFIILQFLVYSITGYLIPGFLLNSTVSGSSSAIGIYQQTIDNALRNGYLKANGFLSEGAHCAQALAIGIVMLFDFNNPKNVSMKTVYTIILYSLASVLTFSVTGIVLVLLTWIFIFIAILNSSKARKKFGAIIFLVLFISILMFVLLGTKMNLQSVINRMVSAISINTSDTSTFYRLYRGFVFWDGLPVINKIFGIGFGNYSSLYYLSEGLKNTALDSEYMNTISYILTSTGILGLLLYSFYLFKMYREANKNGKIMFFLLVAMSLSASAYSSVYWVWMIIAIIFERRTTNYE